MNTASFAKPLRLVEIPASGRRLHLEANPAEREKMADQLGIPSVDDLSADIDVTPMAGDHYRVEAKISGHVTRRCVVTLAPVEEEISEDVSLVLRPPKPGESRDGGGEASGDRSNDPFDVEVDGAEDTEPYFGDRVDLGALLVEYVALGLDPYPRVAGAEFKEHVEDDTAEASPFAVLERLKQQRN
ncbi:YceD family protein [Afifella sp. YEN Y35]|uniref:YceD family protein n=2 Tax=Afifella TaxID=643217 RepID=UPI0039E00BF0